MGFRKIDYNILFASTLDHFASSYYLFLAPILAPLFFEGHNEFLQLVLYFSHIGISFIIKPLAVIIFSKIVEKYGVEVSLILSLFGINLCNLITAILPEYSKIGILSSLSLIFLRLSSTMFSSAESFISKLYILEAKEGKSELRASYYYPFFSSAGAILASIAATIYTDNFRIYFLVSSIIGFGLLIHRIKHFHGFRTKTAEDISLKNLMRNFSVVIRIIILTGVSYITWYVPFIYLNSVVPIVTEIKEAEFAASSTIILLLDLALIPLIGKFLENKNYKFFMKLSSIMLSLSFIIFIPNIPKIFLPPSLIFQGIT